MIVLRDVAKAFGAKEVLRGVSFSVPDGANTVVMGRSGSGKSVTLKLIVGLLRPDRGSVEVDGRAVPALDARELAALRREIGFVFQFAALFDSMTIGDNLRLGLRRRGLARDEIEARVVDALRLVDLEGTADRFPAELSGGMRKRVGIARAVALRPRYILYDEPTTGLDPITTSDMDLLMQRTRDLGVTGVIVTHDLKSAFAVADRMVLLHDGVVRVEGAPEDVRASTDPAVRQFVDGLPSLGAGAGAA